MATPQLPALSPSDTASQPPTDTIQLWKALDSLVEIGLSRDGIVSLSKLGVTGAHKVLEVLEKEGHQGIDDLLSPLEGVTEETLQSWLGAIADKKRGRPRGQNPTRISIDNDPNASTATALATAYLRPPPPSLRRSPSTRSDSPSSSTNLTNPSSQKRVKVTPKTTRRQLYCPDCGNGIKNGFDKHFFLRHIQGDLAKVALFTENELVGCGYCKCDDLELDQGRTFYGVTALLRHIHEEHTQADSLQPVRMPWDFDASFKNLLSGETNIRRNFLALLKAENKKIANKTPPYNAPPTLSWILSSDTLALFNGLQVIGSKIHDIPFTQIPQDVEVTLKNLLWNIYGAAHRKQSSAAYIVNPLPQRSSGASVPQGYNRQPSQTQQRHHPAHDPLNFTAMGGAFEVPQHPKFEIDAPVVPSVERRIQSSPQPQRTPGSQARSGYVGGPSMTTRSIRAPSAIPPPVAQTPPVSFRDPNLNTFSSIYRELDVDENDLFNQFTNG